MQRLKFFLIISIVLIVILGLTRSLAIPEGDSAKRRTASVQNANIEKVNLKEVEEYLWKQQELKKAIQAYFKNAIASGQIVGAGVSIVQGDSVVIAEGYGERNGETGQRADGNTVFRLGSLSKGFTGILAAKVVEDGQMRWNDKVRDYFPEFQLGNPRNTDQITLANLLSHSSGAPYHSFTNLIEAGLPLNEILKKFKEVKPVSAPGSLYSYQNALFAISGEMIHKATGEDLSESLKRQLFDPLGMCSTITDHKSLQGLENVAVPHIRSRSMWRSKKLNDHYYNAIAAGGINASAADMAKWMKFLLGHNPEIMKQSVLEKAFQPVVEIKGRSKYYQRWPGHLSSHYGFGWRIHTFWDNDVDEKKTIWHHGGSVNNFRNEIAIFPEADLGICVLLNSNSRLASRVVPDLYNIIKEVYQSPQAEMASMYIPE
jgi:beta-lactamase class C